MACISSSRRAKLLERLEKKYEQLAKADAAYDLLLEKGDIKSYTFDSGDGRQSATRRDLEELRKTIENLEKQISALERKLNGTGIVAFNLTRRGVNRRTCH